MQRRTIHARRRRLHSVAEDTLRLRRRHKAVGSELEAPRRRRTALPVPEPAADNQNEPGAGADSWPAERELEPAARCVHSPPELGRRIRREMPLHSRSSAADHTHLAAAHRILLLAPLPPQPPAEHCSRLSSRHLGSNPGPEGASNPTNCRRPARRRLTTGAARSRRRHRRERRRLAAAAVVADCSSRSRHWAQFAGRRQRRSDPSSRSIHRQQAAAGSRGRRAGMRHYYTAAAGRHMRQAACSRSRTAALAVARGGRRPSSRELVEAGGGNLAEDILPRQRDF